MGSLYWQFNDCWPVASWSSVDYFGRYKALHYAAKKFYAPIAMGLFLEKDLLIVNISNEKMSDFEGKINVYHCDSKMKIISTHTQDVFVKSLKASDVFSLETTYQSKYNEFIYVDLYDKNGNFIMRQTELFVPPKHFEWKKPEIKINMTDCENGVRIDVSSNVFAKGVCVDFDEYDCVLSDNFFDLTNENGYSITAKTEHTAAELEKAIKLTSVYDIGK
jgi:beta-mannosidase